MKTLDKEREKISPLLLLIVPGGNSSHPCPNSTVSTRHRCVGAGVFCKKAEIRCLHNLCDPSHLGPQQVKSGKYCFSRKTNDNLVPCYQAHFSSPCLFFILSTHFSHLDLPS